MSQFKIETERKTEFVEADDYGVDYATGVATFYDEDGGAVATFIRPLYIIKLEDPDEDDDFIDYLLGIDDCDCDENECGSCTCGEDDDADYTGCTGDCCNGDDDLLSVCEFSGKKTCDCFGR